MYLKSFFAQRIVYSKCDLMHDPDLQGRRTRKYVLSPKTDIKHLIRYGIDYYPGRHKGQKFTGCDVSRNAERDANMSPKRFPDLQPKPPTTTR